MIIKQHYSSVSLDLRTKRNVFRDELFFKWSFVSSSAARMLILGK